jgi:hypothetical protein
MPLNRQNKLYANFSGGIITEANPMAYPDGASTVLENVILKRDGTALRRLGIDLEENARKSIATADDTDAATCAFSVHDWKSVNGDGEIDYVVVQWNGFLYVHNKLEAGWNTSAACLASWEYEPLTVDSSSDDWKNLPLESTVGLGRFFACNKAIAPFYIEESGGTFTVRKLSLNIRDVDGLDETNDTSSAYTPAPVNSDAGLALDTEDLIATPAGPTSWTMSSLSEGAAY